MAASQQILNLEAHENIVESVITQQRINPQGPANIAETVSITQHIISSQGPVNIVETVANLQNNVTYTTISGESPIGKIHFELRKPEINFTGRSDELTSLEKFFKQSPDTKAFIIVVSGLGGIGKTQLIRKFIHDKQSYENVIWINSETSALINESFKTLATARLKIPTTDANGREKESESIIQEVLGKLCQRKSFFVYDNVETVESVKYLLTLQPSGQNPHIVITSRIQQFDDGIDVIQLKEWEINEAKAYVSSTLKNINDLESDIELLVNMLQCFPLALRQATSYIKYQRKTKDFKIAGYIAKCHTQEMLDSKTFQDNFTNLYKQTTLTTWNITINTIQQDEARGPLAIQILNIMAYFAPDNIRRDFFRYLRCDFQDNEVGWDEHLISAISLLINYSMVDSQDMESLLSIHRLVQEVMKVKLSKTDQQKEVLQNALTLVSKLINDAKDKNIHTHAVSVFLFALKFSDLVTEFMELPCSILVNLEENGKYTQGKVFGEAILKPLSMVLSNNDAVLLKISFYTAVASIMLGLNEHALQKNQEVLKQQKVLLGEDHPDTLKTMTNIAFSNRELGNHNLALQSYEEILQRQKSILGEDHPDTLTTKSNIAFSNRALGNHNLALQSYEVVFQRRKIILGEDHPDTLITMSNIALTNGDLGNNTLALKSFEEILKKRKFILGEDHPDTLITMTTIARSYIELGNHTLALQLFEEVFQKQIFILGEDHPDTLITKSNIAFSNKALGNLNSALQSYEEVFEKRKLIFGVDHPDTLRTMLNIGDSYFKLGDHTLALQLFEEVFQKQIFILGKDHPDTLITKSNIAASNKALGNLNSALQSYEEVFETRKLIFGIDHPDTLRTMSNIALSNFQLGNLTFALQLFKELFQKQNSVLGEDHPDTLKTMSNIASLNRELGNHTLALQLFKEVLHKQKSILGEGHPETLVAMSHVAYSNRKIGNYNLALQLYEEVLQRQKYLLGKDHRDTLRTISNIANLELEMPIPYFM